jgi:hypothetical protein
MTMASASAVLVAVLVAVLQLLRVVSAAGSKRGGGAVDNYPTYSTPSACIPPLVSRSDACQDQSAVVPSPRFSIALSSIVTRVERQVRLQGAPVLTSSAVGGDLSSVITQTCTGTSINRGVWLNFTSALSQQVTISSCTGSSPSNVRLAVLQGACLESSNSLSCVTVQHGVCADGTSGTGRETIKFIPKAGRLYRVLVLGGSGTPSITFSYAQSPPAGAVTDVCAAWLTDVPAVMEATKQFVLQHVTCPSGGCGDLQAQVHTYWPGTFSCAWHGVSCDRSLKPEVIELSFCNGVAVTRVPPAFLCPNATIDYLVLSRNAFTGTLPSELFSLPRLTGLEMADNTGSVSFSSVAPSSPSTNLFQVLLHQNTLKGTIPSWMSSISSLSILDLSQNKLTGTIPSLPTYLNRLYLNNNNGLIGTIPGSFSSLSLSHIDIRCTHLVGSISPPTASNFGENLCQLLDLCETATGPQYLPALDCPLPAWLTSTTYPNCFASWATRCTVP